MLPLDTTWEWTSRPFVPPSGSGSLGLLVVGEAPGEHEERQLRPFVETAPAGSMFERLIRRVGISRDQLRITNVVPWRPHNNWLEGAPWEAAMVEAGRPYLDQVIHEMKPRAILVLGNVSLKRLTTYGGKRSSITFVRGFALQSNGYGVPVVGSYHPSYLQRGMHKLCGVFVHDLAKALRIAKDGVPVPPANNYTTFPTPDDAEKFLAGLTEQDVLSYDIETPYSSGLDEEDAEDEDGSYTIIRISFCYRTGYAISFPWQEPFISVAKRLLASPCRKRVWNGNFDNPRLRAAGCAINGRIYDEMWRWKHLQARLPRNLQFVSTFYTNLAPWKHLNDSEPEFYSCQDAEALHEDGVGIDADLRKVGLWETCERHVVDLVPVLELMSRNGLPIDDKKRLEFKAELEAKLQARDAKLQSLVPDSLKPIHPKYGYKRTPADVTGLVLRYFPGSDTPVIRHPPESSQQGSLVTYTPEVLQRWCRVEPFLYNSWQHVLAYIRYRGHPVPKAKKRNGETTESDALIKLWHSKKDEVYRLIVECRQLSKVISTYAGKWVPAADGAVHPVAGFWGAMHRISWRNPPIAATIQDKKPGLTEDEEAIAAGFRKCVTARPGHVLLEADWSGIEALLVGYFSGDEAYMRLARLGVHGYLVSHLIGKPADLAATDDELALYFYELKKAHTKLYDDAKHINYLSNYGGGPGLAAELYGLSQADAKGILKLLDTLFPKRTAWRAATIQQAYKTCLLTNPVNYRMWFWDIHARLNSKGIMTYTGDDVKSALAFVPRDTAAAILKDALLQLRPLAESGILCGCAHDSVIAHLPVDRLSETANTIRRAMEAPVAWLGGLKIGVEIKVGTSWDKESMKLYTEDKDNA